MPRLIWSAAAIQDLARLRAFLDPKSPDAARRAVAAIRQGVKILADHPEIGRTIEDLPVGFREWSIMFGSGSYIARYRIEARQVVILTVRHGRELPGR